MRLTKPYKVSDMKDANGEAVRIAENFFEILERVRQKKDGIIGQIGLPPMTGPVS